MALVGLASIGITEVPSIISDFSNLSGETVPSPPNPVTPSFMWSLNCALSWGEIYWSDEYGIGDAYSMNDDEDAHYWRVRSILLIMGIWFLPEVYIAFKRRRR